MAALKKQLEEAQRLKDQAEKSKAEAEKAKIEAEKARDKAEQKGYDLGVAETKETLRAEVPAGCRIYCAQTWDEALNRAGVEGSSELRKPKNIFYPPAIRASDLLSAQDKVASTVVDPSKESQPQDPSLPNKRTWCFPRSTIRQGCNGSRSRSSFPGLSARLGFNYHTRRGSLQR